MIEEIFDEVYFKSRAVYTQMQWKRLQSDSTIQQIFQSKQLKIFNKRLFSQLKEIGDYNTDEDEPYPDMNTCLEKENEFVRSFDEVEEANTKIHKSDEVMLFRHFPKKIKQEITFIENE